MKKILKCPFCGRETEVGLAHRAGDICKNPLPSQTEEGVEPCPGVMKTHKGAKDDGVLVD